MASLLDRADVRPTRRRLSADQYQAMAEAGILGRADRVELIEGEIIEMAPIGHGHMGATNVLTELLVLACRGRGVVGAGNSIRLDDWNMPEPDFTVFRHRADFYRREPWATPADVLLVVEVSETSLRYDRTVKLPLYARARLPEYWIVDLAGRTVDVHRNPAGDGYTEVTRAGVGDTLTLAANPAISITLAEMFA